jgi:hypothetical protein
VFQPRLSQVQNPSTALLNAGSEIYLGGGRGGDQFACFDRANRMAERIARVFTAKLIELFYCVRFRFHAFGDDLRPEIMGECHDRAQDDEPCSFPFSRTNG